MSDEMNTELDAIKGDIPQMPEDKSKEIFVILKEKHENVMTPALEERQARLKALEEEIQKEMEELHEEHMTPIFEEAAKAAGFENLEALHDQGYHLAGHIPTEMMVVKKRDLNPLEAMMQQAMGEQG